jgi:hypothetical protein
MSRRTARRIAALLSTVSIVTGGAAALTLTGEGTALAAGCCSPTHK